MSTHTLPPEPVQGVSGPTYIAHDGAVWHRSMCGWTCVHDPLRQMAVFREIERDTADWFHKRAAELADEIEAAMRVVGMIPERKAA